MKNECRKTKCETPAQFAAEKSRPSNSLRLHSNFFFSVPPCLRGDIRPQMPEGGSPAWANRLRLHSASCLSRDEKPAESLKPVVQPLPLPPVPAPGCAPAGAGGGAAGVFAPAGAGEAAGLCTLPGALASAAPFAGVAGMVVGVWSLPGITAGAAAPGVAGCAGVAPGTTALGCPGAGAVVGAFN
jgi:hypothetical protein